MLPPFHPSTHPQLAAALDFLHQSLEDEELQHVEEPDDVNPNIWSVAAVDEFGYANAGIVAWDEEKQMVRFLAHDPMRENHDLAEGVPVEESRCWFDLKRIDYFMAHLVGEVRQIVAKARRIALDNSKQV